MKKAVVALVAVAALAVICHPARATTIVTPIVPHSDRPLGTYFGGSCLVLNAGPSSINVSVQLVDENGDIVLSEAATIEPDVVEWVFFTEASARAFCRVEGAFSKRLVKVSYNPIGSDDHVTFP
jgi:hypothetical protein